MIAFGALLAFREAGLRCPADISLFGFDNLELAEMTSPPLSSVSQPGYQMGTAAARLLIERVRDNHEPTKARCARYLLEASRLGRRPRRTKSGDIGSPHSNASRARLAAALGPPQLPRSFICISAMPRYPNALISVLTTF